MATIKRQKIRCYYDDVTRDKPNITHSRHFIHGEKSGGLWASVRDLSQKEKLANNSVGNEIVVKITVGYNPAILENWERLILLDAYNNTYRIKEKPDEYEYDKSDTKFSAYRFKDDTVYGGDDIYE